MSPFHKVLSLKSNLWHIKLTNVFLSQIAGVTKCAKTKIFCIICAKYLFASMRNYTKKIFAQFLNDFIKTKNVQFLFYRFNAKQCKNFFAKLCFFSTHDSHVCLWNLIRSLKFFKCALRRFNQLLLLLT